MTREEKIILGVGVVACVAVILCPRWNTVFTLKRTREVREITRGGEFWSPETFMTNGMIVRRGLLFTGPILSREAAEKKLIADMDPWTRGLDEEFNAARDTEYELVETKGRVVVGRLIAEILLVVAGTAGLWWYVRPKKKSTARPAAKS